MIKEEEDLGPPHPKPQLYALSEDNTEETIVFKVYFISTES